jgi:heme-degrading monooxygenase HmoA
VHHFATSFLAIALAAAVAMSGCASHAPAAPSTASAPSTPSLCRATIARVWHGRTPNAKADEYAAYLAAAITKFPTIPGNLGYQMMKETIGDETHFSVISYWISRDAIHGYAGADISATRPLPRDAEYLIDPEPQVKNYDLSTDGLGCGH